MLSYSPFSLCRSPMTQQLLDQQPKTWKMEPAASEPFKLLLIHRKPRWERNMNANEYLIHVNLSLFYIRTTTTSWRRHRVLKRERNAWISPRIRKSASLRCVQKSRGWGFGFCSSSQSCTPFKCKWRGMSISRMKKGRSGSTKLAWRNMMCGWKCCMRSRHTGRWWGHALGMELQLNNATKASRCARPVCCGSRNSAAGMLSCNKQRWLARSFSFYSLIKHTCLFCRRSSGPGRGIRSLMHILCITDAATITANDVASFNRNVLARHGKRRFITPNRFSTCKIICAHEFNVIHVCEHNIIIAIVIIIIILYGCRTGNNDETSILPMAEIKAWHNYKAHAHGHVHKMMHTCAGVITIVAEAIACRCNILPQLS